MGVGSPRDASAVATSTAATLPKEWPKKANGRPESRMGRIASITASTSAGSDVVGGWACLGPRPAYWTAQSSKVGGSGLHSRKAEAEPPA